MKIWALVFIPVLLIAINTVSAPSSNQTCTDTDGGLNYYVNGQISGTWLGDNNSYIETLDFCNDATLQEYSCEDRGDGTSGIVQTGYLCPYGCSNGACLTMAADFNDDGCVDMADFTGPFADHYGETPASPGWDERFDLNSDEVVDDSDQSIFNGYYGAGCEDCTDTDGGKDYYVKGEISTSNDQGGTDCCTVGDDTCVSEGTHVSEKFCDPSSSWGGSYEIYQCPNGCQDGACISEPTTCPASIDITATKSVYYPGDIVGLTITVYDSAGSPISGHKFLVTGVINGQSMGPSTLYTDSSGGYQTSGAASPGTYEYTVYTEEEGCDSVSDTVSFVVEAECGDGHCSTGETIDSCPEDCGTCVEGEARQCGSDVGACQSGLIYCRGGQWGSCEGAIDPVQEICGNGLDDDCDGLADDGCQCPASVDLVFDKDVYYVGDTVEIELAVYDASGSVMPNQQVRTNYYLNGVYGSEGIINTGPTGVYETSGPVYNHQVGTLQYNVWIDSSGCDHIRDTETITIKEYEEGISIPSVWSDKAYYTTGEDVTVYAKVVDWDGTPAEPGEGTSVRFSISGQRTLFHMDYNPSTGYYEKTVQPISTGAVWVYLTATKGTHTATNNDYYFKVSTQEKFMKCAIFEPINEGTVSGWVKVHANAKSDVKIAGMDLSIKGESMGFEIPMRDCTSSSTSSGTSSVHTMDCYYEWDSNQFQGEKVVLMLTSWNANWDRAVDSANVYVGGGTGFITVDIESPKDGETVSGSQEIRATARSSYMVESIGLEIESDNSGVGFPMSDCESTEEIPLCTAEGYCGPSVHAMTCRYTWDTSLYRGKKVTLMAIGNGKDGSTAEDEVRVYVGNVVTGWTEDEVKGALENEEFVRMFGMQIRGVKGHELLSGVTPVIEVPLKRIVEPWKKYWAISDTQGGMYTIILEDGSGPSPKSGEFLFYVSEKALLEIGSLPEGVLPLERALDKIKEMLGLERLDTSYGTGLILLNLGGVTATTQAVDISQVVPVASTSSGGGGGVTGMAFATTATSSSSSSGGGSGGGGGSVRNIPAYWVIMAVGVNPDGSMERLEILLDARTGEILVGPTKDVEDLIREKVAPLFNQLGLEMGPIRKISEEEMAGFVREMHDLCEKIGSIDQGGDYWLASDSEGVIVMIVRYGKMINSVIVESTETMTNEQIGEKLSSVSEVSGGEEITPALFIFDMQRLVNLPGLPDSSKQSVEEAIEKTENAIKDSLGVDDINVHQMNMVMMYNTPYCPPCPAGEMCEACPASSTIQFVYAKGLAEGPVKFEYVIGYPNYDVMCSRTSDMEERGLSVHLWTSKTAVSPGETVIVKSKVTDSLGNPVPNAEVVLTISPVGGVQTCPVCEVPAGEKAEIEQEQASTGIGGGYACKPCVYEEEVIQTVIGETDEQGAWTYLLKMANVRSGEYKLELNAHKPGYVSGADKKIIVVKNIGPVDNRTFEPIDLARIVIRLETMNINLLKLKPKAQTIADYYMSVGEVEKAEAWQGIVTGIDTISGHIEEAKQAIKDLVQDPSDEKLVAVKGAVVRIKSEVEDLIREIIMVA